METLDRSFYSGSALTVAPQLLNKILQVGECTGRIVEVEAYTADDPASHSFRGRTNRNAAMFGPAGHLYVYFVYGMHFCANVVTGEVGDGQAVLIRAVQPLDGVELMRQRRGRLDHLADGPGKLCSAFGIDRSMDATDLTQATDSNLPGAPCVLDDCVEPPLEPLVTPRVGIRVGVDLLRRWLV